MNESHLHMTKHNNEQLIDIDKKSKYSLSQILGPGLLMTGAAVGVSHLVQSTRAGANFGLELLPLIFFVNIAKYPFFEIGHRYTAATGESLLKGYYRLGAKYLKLFYLLNFFVSIITTAGVLFVTASLCSEMIKYDNLFHISFFLILICSFILMKGNYKTLDQSMKIIIITLLLTTLMTLIIAFDSGQKRVFLPSEVSPWTITSLPFLIALMGWMPAPIELSVWQSLWLIEKNKAHKHKLSLKEAQMDFNIGYFLTLFLAILFLVLGACVMFRLNTTFPSSGSGFAKSFIHMYTSNLGTWAYPIVAISSFTVMFSTSLTVIDAYPRSLCECHNIISQAKKNPKKYYWIFLILILFFSLLIIKFFNHNLKLFIDSATILSFIAGPIFAYLNYKLIYSNKTPKSAQPNQFFKYLSWFGLCFLICFLGVFLSSFFI